VLHGPVEKRSAVIQQQKQRETADAMLFENIPVTAVPSVFKARKLSVTITVIMTFVYKEDGLKGRPKESFLRESLKGRS
jgi:hypothetical protein